MMQSRFLENLERSHEIIFMGNGDSEKVEWKFLEALDEVEFDLIY